MAAAHRGPNVGFVMRRLRFAIDGVVCGCLAGLPCAVAACHADLSRHSAIGAAAEALAKADQVRIVHSRPVLVAKRDLASRCIRRA